MKLVVQSTDRCHRLCNNCFQRALLRNKDLSLKDIRESVSPYIRENPGKVSVTHEGGETCRHPEFAPITGEILASGPHVLDTFTSGELFYQEHNDFWRIIKGTGVQARIVISYDESHRTGCTKSDKWLDRGFAKMRGLWDSGSRIGLVVSSTRFSGQPEEEVEQEMHAASARNGIPIEVGSLGWKNVFRWARDYVVRIIVPAAEICFELANRNANRNAQRIEFVYVREFFNLTPNSVEQSLQPALWESPNSTKYGVRLEIAERVEMRGEEMRRYGNCLRIERSIGTPLEKLAGRILYPSNQIYIAPTGLVYANPIAMVKGRSSGDISKMPLGKIVESMYPGRARAD